MRITTTRAQWRLLIGAMTIAALALGGAAMPGTPAAASTSTTASTAAVSAGAPVALAAKSSGTVKVTPLSASQKKNWYHSGSTFTLKGKNLNKVTKIVVGGKATKINKLSSSKLKVRIGDFGSSTRHTVKVYVGSKRVYSSWIHIKRYRVIVDKLSKHQTTKTYRSTSWMTIKGHQLEHVTKATIAGNSVKMTKRKGNSMRLILPAVSKTGSYKVVLYDGRKAVRTQTIKIKKYVTQVKKLSASQQKHWYGSGHYVTVKGESLERITSAVVDGKKATIYHRSTSSFRVRLPNVSSSGIHSLALKVGGKTNSSQPIRVLKKGASSAATNPHTVGPFPTPHVQGIAVDEKRGFLYYSMTTMLVKTDMSGKVLGKLTGLDGHLGDLAVDPQTGEVYASLEYKQHHAWTIGIFDVASLSKSLNAEKSGLVDTVYLHDVARYYDWDGNGDGKIAGDDPASLDHQYGVAGIDGVTFGPSFADRSDRTLTVAAGIFKNVSRTDNNNQILMQYDISAWDDFRKPLRQSKPATVGPQSTEGTYFVTTGNTNWGVQNLAYDPVTDIYMMSVYRGTKKDWPNYGMFAVDASSKPSVAKDGRSFLPLAQGARTDSATGVTGWQVRNPFGLAPLSDGTWLVNTDSGVDGKKYATTTRYRFSLTSENPFG